MAQATVVSYSKFRIKLGNGASPEVFTAPCGLNTRALNMTKNVNEIDVPDCTDEDAPAWIAREVRSLDWGISGEGVLAAEAYQAWKDAFNSLTPVHVMVEEEFPDSPPGLVISEGYAHLTTFNRTGNRGEKVTVAIEMQGDGALTDFSPT